MNRAAGAVLAASMLLSAAGSAQDAASDASQVVRGHEVFQYWCVQCHGPGAGNGGTSALAFKYHGALPALLEQRTDLTAEQIKYVVRHGANIMPFFRKMEISDSELDALAAYLTQPVTAPRTPGKP